MRTRSPLRARSSHKPSVHVRIVFAHARRSSASSRPPRISPAPSLHPAVAVDSSSTRSPTDSLCHQSATIFPAFHYHHPAERIPSSYHIAQLSTLHSCNKSPTFFHFIPVCRRARLSSLRLSLARIPSIHSCTSRARAPHLHLVRVSSSGAPALGLARALRYYSHALLFPRLFRPLLLLLSFFFVPFSSLLSLLFSLQTDPPSHPVDLWRYHGPVTELSSSCHISL